MGKRVVVMPAYNAAQTLVWTYAAIPRDEIDEVILVDDGSADETVEIARRLGLNVIVHPHNAGYGANQKTCYMEALRRGADVVVMVHPDGQYDPAFLPEIVKPIFSGEADVVLTGADRIAANGDVANKIGTYGLAIAAAHHSLPFVVVAPTSTLDPRTRTGEEIPIEERDPSEVSTRFAARNPAFDVTPSELIRAIVTEEGVHRPPYTASLPVSSGAAAP